MKICTKCGELKNLSSFSPDKRKKDGLQSQCKNCGRLVTKKFREENPEIIQARGKRYRAKNTEALRDRKAKYYAKNIKKLRNKQSKYYAKDIEKSRIMSAKWRAENPEKFKENCRKADKKRRNTPKGKLAINISSAISHSLNGAKAGRHWENLTGFTLNQLQIHLEKFFSPDMTWDNYGKWHIDHKIPIAVFNFDKPEDIDFKRCWALENLQPMWAKENMSKGAKLDKHFQPSLQIAAGEIS